MFMNSPIEYRYIYWLTHHHEFSWYLHYFMTIRASFSEFWCYTENVKNPEGDTSLKSFYKNMLCKAGYNPLGRNQGHDLVKLKMKVKVIHMTILAQTMVHI